MHSPGINGGELTGQPANPGSRGKMAVKTECVCVYVCVYVVMRDLRCSLQTLNMKKRSERRKHCLG